MAANKSKVNIHSMFYNRFTSVLQRFCLCFTYVLQTFYPLSITSKKAQIRCGFRLFIIYCRAFLPCQDICLGVRRSFQVDFLSFPLAFP